MKFVITTLFVHAFLLSTNLALNTENYTAFIQELSHDDKFLEEYTIWSLKLFSQPDYVYGNPFTKFPCPIEKSNEDRSITTSVHNLRPSDVKCIAALGDSFTIGLGINAITPMDLLTENRGVSWSIGGDYTYSKVFSLANVLRKYNPKLQGFSTKESIIVSHKQNTTSHGLNIAQPWTGSSDMIYQAELLIEKLKHEKLCDWNEDWKIVTLFVGNHDLCNVCQDDHANLHTPEQYVNDIRNALDKLFNASLPRTLINVVPAFDVRTLRPLIYDNYVCEKLHQQICPCTSISRKKQAKILNDYVKQYHKLLFDLIHSGRYDQRDDFTVVYQPFMAGFKLPAGDIDDINLSYFAPDCFHFSGKGHSLAAISLWNNMFEPVGAKKHSWHIEEPLRCPQDEYPYIFTSKNSAKALDALKLKTKNSTNDRKPSSNTNTRNEDSIKYHHKKHTKSHSEPRISRWKLVIVLGFLSMTVTILIFGSYMRRRVPITTRRNEPHHLEGADNPQYQDDSDGDGDDDEVWNRTKT